MSTRIDLFESTRVNVYRVRLRNSAVESLEYLARTQTQAREELEDSGYDVQSVSFCRKASQDASHDYNMTEFLIRARIA